jgi:hypothetical protein
MTMTADQTVTATFAAGSGGGGTGGASAPTVHTVTISPGAFHAAPSGLSAIAAKRRYGSKVSYTLDQNASVSFAVVRRLPGRMTQGGRCVKPTRANRKAPACTRVRPVPGGFTLTAVVGANSFRFTGRLAGRKLTPGKYQLIATPSANGLVGRPTSASFQILK